MFDIYKEEMDFGGKKLILESGKIGRTRENRALLEAGSADLILVVVEGDLRETEINTISFETLKCCLFKTFLYFYISMSI